jgi:hypothetical protein
VVYMFGNFPSLYNYKVRRWFYRNYNIVGYLGSVVQEEVRILHLPGQIAGVAFGGMRD